MSMGWSASGANGMPWAGAGTASRSGSRRSCRTPSLQTPGSFAIITASATERSRSESRAALARLGLEPDGYFLYVSRLEPENNALLVVKAFEKVATDKRLVIVGDAPYAQSYITELKSPPDPRILFP